MGQGSWSLTRVFEEDLTRKVTFEQKKDLIEAWEGGMQYLGKEHYMQVKGPEMGVCLTCSS